MAVNSENGIQMKEQGVVVVHEDVSSVKKQFLAATLCSLLTIMYGNAVGWSSSAVPQIEDGLLSDGPISPQLSGWIGGSYCLGAVAISPFCGLFADRKGRKLTAYVVGFIYAISWLIILCTNSFAWVIVARVFSGVATSSSITVVSIYNKEIAHLKIQTIVGSMLALTYVLGMEMSYILGAFFSYKTIAIIYLCFCIGWLCLWWMMPETPAYLLLHGQEEKALLVIQWLHSVEYKEAAKELARLKDEQTGTAKSASVKEFFLDPAARKAIVLVSLLICFQAICGGMALSSYARDIFENAGGSISAETGAMIYGASMILGALMPPILADRAPRKVLLCVSSLLMGCGMVAFGTIQYLKSRLSPAEEEDYSSILPPIILSLTSFVYFLGMGSIPYMSAAELFSNENRGVGGAIVAIVMWISCFVLLQFYGVAVLTFGDYTVFYFFACVLFVCFLFVIIFLPETKGKHFGEIRKLLVKQ